MQKRTEPGWSDSLIAQTRALLESPPLGLLATVSMKNIDGRFGAIALDGDAILLTEKHTHQRWSYPDFDAVIDAGWVID